MDALDLFFGPVPCALKVMFKYGVLPREEDFLELTHDQYLKYIETVGDAGGQKVFMLVSHDPSRTVGEDNDIMCLTEIEKNGFMKAVSIIDEYSKGRNLTTDEEKLRFAASKLPDPFTKGTEYAISHSRETASNTGISFHKVKRHSRDDSDGL